MKRILLITFVTIVLLAGGCGFEGDPIIDDAYTQNVYPGKTDTYQVGSENLQYLKGYYEEIYLDGVLLEIAGAPAGGDVGGLYGINVETLADVKTLTADTDEIYQYLDPGGANRNITLDTASATAGDRFVIRNNDAFDDNDRLVILQAAVTIDQIRAGDIIKVIFDGTNWVAANPGSGEADNKRVNLAIGYQTLAFDGGTALGYSASAYTDGVAVGASARGYSEGVGVGGGAYGYTGGVGVGYNARGQTYGVAIGSYADGANYGIAIGRLTNTNDNRYSMALGYYSETERVGETSINIDVQSDQENNVVQGRWALETADATPVEMFCAGYGTSRFTIRASSALAFTMKVVARDNVAGHVAMYTVNDGLIKRDAANNTVMVNCTVVVVHEDDAAWDVAVTADDANEALIITVTGDADNSVQWATVMDGVETHF